jgi:hypothetical protein
MMPGFMRIQTTASHVLEPTPWRKRLLRADPASQVHLRAGFFLRPTAVSFN